MAMSTIAASAQHVNLTPLSISGSSEATIAFRTNRATAATKQTVIFAETTNRLFGALLFSDNNMYSYCDTGVALAYGVYTFSTITGWQHVAVVFDGSQTGNSNRLKLYFNGVLQTQSYPGASIPASVASVSLLRIGRKQDSADVGTGEYAEVAVYNKALTADEVVSLHKGFKPNHVRPSALRSYNPLVKSNLCLVTNSATSVNSPTFVGHPRRYG
jgi:hypothetical protein